MHIGKCGTLKQQGLHKRSAVCSSDDAWYKHYTSPVLSCYSCCYSCCYSYKKNRNEKNLEQCTLLGLVIWGTSKQLQFTLPKQWTTSPW